MSVDWPLVSLTELYEIGSGLSKPAKDFGTGFPFLSFKDVYHNFFVPDKLTELVQTNAREREVCSIKRGDIFLTRTSETINELGMSSVALKDYKDATFNGFTKRLRPKSGNNIIPEYVGYFFRSPSFRKDMMAFSTLMSTRASLNNEMISRLKLLVPPREKQESIAHILKSLDDKIIINRQINQTLEEMAQAIFKSWFVDFDPVKAKIEAKANGQDPERAAMCAISGKTDAELDQLPPDQLSQLRTTAALFPDELIDSELGWIPEGWTIKEIKDWGDVVCGKTPPKNDDSNYGGNVPFIKIPDMHGNVFATRTSDTLSQKGALTQPKKQVPPGSVCVSCIATVGQVVLTSEYSHTNQQINTIVPDRITQNYYLFFSMRERKSLLHELASGGSATLNLNTGNFSKIPILYPNDSLLDEFYQKVTHCFKLILLNDKQSQTIENMRDILLPKLLSGEIGLESALTGL